MDPSNEFEEDVENMSLEECNLDCIRCIPGPIHQLNLRLLPVPREIIESVMSAPQHDGRGEEEIQKGNSLNEHQMN